MMVGDKLKDLGRRTAKKVEVARLKTRSFLRERDARYQERQASKDLKRSLDAQASKDFLDREKKRQEDNTLIEKAKKARFEQSFAGRSLRAVKQYKPVNKPLKLASKNRKSLVSTQKKGVVRSDVLRINR